MVAVIMGMGVGVVMLLGVLGDRIARIAEADSVADSVALAVAAEGYRSQLDSDYATRQPASAAAETIAARHHFDIVAVNWFPLESGQCRVEVLVREQPDRPANLLVRSFSSALVSSQAAALSQLLCGSDQPKIK